MDVGRALRDRVGDDLLETQPIIRPEIGARRRRLLAAGSIDGVVRGPGKGLGLAEHGTLALGCWR